MQGLILAMPECIGELPSAALAHFSGRLQHAELSFLRLGGVCASLADHLAGSLTHLNLRVGLHVWLCKLPMQSPSSSGGRQGTRGAAWEVGKANLLHSKP